MTRVWGLGLAVLTGLGIAGVLALEEPQPDGCLRGEPLQERLEDAWRRWAVDGDPPRNCDLRALQEASEALGRCSGVTR